MDYHLSPAGSSPPSYDDYSPANSQGRAERESTTTDQKFKRRRLDLDSHSHNLPDPTHPINAPVYTLNPRSYLAGPYMPPPYNFGHFAPSPNAYWDEEAALEYLASGNGFVQDMRLAVGPSRLTAYQPQNHSPNSTCQPPVPEAPNYHLGSSQPRPAPSMPATTSLRPLPLENFQQIPDHTWPAPHPTHHAPGTDSGPFTSDHREISRLMNLTANLRPPPHAFSPIETNSSTSSTSNTANQIKLVLSRATQESIDALAEHKRECPACQLEFEPDNFMAVISCCDTAMHATCLSAWVNSATYAKSKTCMKCRRSIDARRPLNTVVPPVNDQTWDEGVDLNAPEAIKGDQKVEVPVNPRADRGRRYIRSTYANYRPTTIQAPENMSPEWRRQLNHLQQEQVAEFDGIRRRLRGMMAHGNRLAKEEALAQRALAEAQTIARQGGSSNIEGLRERCEDVKHQKDQWCQDIRSLQRTLEGLPRIHERQVTAFIESAMFPRPGEANTSPLRSASAEFGPSASMSPSS